MHDSGAAGVARLALPRQAHVGDWKRRTLRLPTLGWAKRGPLAPPLGGTEACRNIGAAIAGLLTGALVGMAVALAVHSLLSIHGPATIVLFSVVLIGPVAIAAPSRRGAVSAACFQLLFFGVLRTIPGPLVVPPAVTAARPSRAS